MTLCKHCIMPSTRPDLSFDSAGVCSACRSIEKKNQVDWTDRGLAWDQLIIWAREEAKSRGNSYDCIAAVSGGKDSTFIVLKCLEAGLRPLGVSFEPSLQSVRGRLNLENLQNYCDVVQIRKNKEVYQKLRQIGLRELGDSEYPNHVGIFTSVTWEAVARNIPLILWGESPQMEYSPPNEKSINNAELDRSWLEEFGGLLGLRISDLHDRFSSSELGLYTWPAKEEIQRVGLRSRFLGHYFKWDTVNQIQAATAAGFRPADRPPTGAYWKFENVDDPEAVAFHDFLALCKYGYTRAMAQLSIEVRHGYKTRNEALTLAQMVGDFYPQMEEDSFCDSIRMPQDEVRSILKSFVNKSIWKSDYILNLERIEELG